MKAITKIFVCLGAAALVAVVSIPAQAQEAPVLRHVDVVGEAEVRAAPDQAIVTLGVESRDQSLTTAQADNGQRMARLLAVTGRFKVDSKDVKTDYASIEPQYDDRGGLRVISGYRFTKLVVVRLTDLTKVEAFVAEALVAGANRLDSVAFGITDPSSLRAQARVLAVRDALVRARALATELGQTVGRPIFVSESSSNPYPAPMFKAMAAPAAFEGAGAADTFAPGQVTVSSQVTAQFELKD